MPTSPLLVLAATLLLLARAGAPATSPRDTLLVTASWLAAHIDDPDLVVLHVGEPEKYAAQHLPHARLVTRAAIAVSERTGPGLTLEMPQPEDLRQRLAALGISDNSRIVVYAAQDWLSPATRAVFTLEYAGLGDRTMMLDGGMEAWTRAGQALTDVIPPPPTGMLSPLKIQPLVVDAKYVFDHLKDPKVAIIDARSASFYDGIQTGGSHDGPSRTGHIPGARSVPFTEVVDNVGMFRPASELQALFMNAGVKPGDAVVAYCHIGQQATATLFAARTLGYAVLLYDGSFEDWSRHTDYPVENQKGAALKPERRDSADSCAGSVSWDSCCSRRSSRGGRGSALRARSTAPPNPPRLFSIFGNPRSDHLPSRVASEAIE